jgi:hypothetical protein
VTSFDELEAAAAAMTDKGPWEVSPRDCLKVQDPYGPLGILTWSGNARGVVAMRNAFPALLRVARAAETINTAYLDPNWPGWGECSTSDDACDDLSSCSAGWDAAFDELGAALAALKGED